MLLLNIILLVVMFIAAIIAPRAVDITNHIMTVVSVQRKLPAGYLSLIFLIFRQAIVGLRCGDLGTIADSCRFDALDIMFC
ncbi:hypothetical protein BDV41DRAFT_535401 [Aspergillus transmontanensis]|uniref:Uncharacterized protein n=1 Tax=Aspergillus transmontanensis TaxID=1034304 RepID=A0A5N6W3E7_9EURO|nr:hypothetical protein BDV41DRAFT_535401 [Aspergillus transmontanensis]